MKNNWQTKTLGEVCEIAAANSNAHKAVEAAQYALWDRSLFVLLNMRFLKTGRD